MSLANETSAIFDAALALPREKREELLYQLVISLEPEGPKDPDYDRWLREELERRSQGFERGEIKAVDFREALQEIRAQLHARRTA